jgi:DNA-binding Xre family transcriptional regulator
VFPLAMAAIRAVSSDCIDRPSQQRRSAIRRLGRSLLRTVTHARLFGMDETWDRVAKAVDERMLDMNLTMTELSDRAELSPITVRRVRQAKGTKLTVSSMRKLSTALGWTPDSIQRLINGQEPIIAPTPQDNQPVALSGVIDATGLTPDQIAYLQGIALGLRLSNN